MHTYTGAWCQLPYYNHKNGCPNYGRPGCPPKAALLIDTLDFDYPIYLVHSEFDLEEHIHNMHLSHPTWSIHMQRNVLYWQNTSRKQLRERVAEVKDLTENYMISYCPEGRGLNVYATAKRVGLQLERIKGLKTCRHVALTGTFKKGIIHGS